MGTYPIHLLDLSQSAGFRLLYKGAIGAPRSHFPLLIRPVVNRLRRSSRSRRKQTR
jgi:hypothetical protein